MDIMISGDILQYQTYQIFGYDDIWKHKNIRLIK